MSKTKIIDGECVLGYGLDADGIALICDEAIAHYRKMVEADPFLSLIRISPELGISGEILLPSVLKAQREHSHEEAIKTATNTVITALEKRGEYNGK